MADGEARIAVTGAGGRLGRVLLAELGRLGADVVPWSRPRYDLDDPMAANRLVEEDRPSLVIHAAAWVDVDGCAREPELAERRNGQATRELANALAANGADLVFISTNEVFDGRRTDGRGYAEDDVPNPANAYGRSKLSGERAATEAYRGTNARLWIVRSAWLYGPSGNDFPERIVAAADRSPADPLKVVADEIGTPTHTVDLALAIHALVGSAPPGIYHLVGTQHISRYEWAADLLHALRPSKAVEPIAGDQYDRPSIPPPWGVLSNTLAARLGLSVRPWSEARAEVGGHGAGD